MSNKVEVIIIFGKEEEEILNQATDFFWILARILLRQYSFRKHNTEKTEFNMNLI